MTEKEGRNVILPCSLSTKENIESECFDWRKDRRTNVFLYDNGLTGQDEQFKGRVSYFKEELKNGNASIMVQNIKMVDSGDYICFITLQQKREKININLVVGE